MNVDFWSDCSQTEILNDSAGAHSTKSLKISGCKRWCPIDLRVRAPAAPVLTHSLSWPSSDDHRLIRFVVWWFISNPSNRQKFLEQSLKIAEILLQIWSYPEFQYYLRYWPVMILDYYCEYWLDFWIEYWLVQQFSDLLQVCIFLENWSARVPWIW